MPAISPYRLVAAILDAIIESAGLGIYESPRDRIHPRKFAFEFEGHQFSLWAYVWTLTHGGRSSLPNEYRIQMTGVHSPLPMNPDSNGYTALLGYHPNLQLFAGFDIYRHRSFTEGSPSVQIPLSALDDASKNGLGFGTKDNKEIAIGVRPDQFLEYLRNAQGLHSFGADLNSLGILKSAAEAAPLPKRKLAHLGARRKKVIQTITRVSRAAAFSKQVLSAYDNRCAVTQIQLKLLDAAHILPVAARESKDDVTNGLALSPTIHRAYDASLIYLDENFIMRINKHKMRELVKLRLGGGLQSFRTALNRRIYLPSDQSSRPKVDFIRAANKYRRIPGY